MGTNFLARWIALCLVGSAFSQESQPVVRDSTATKDWFVSTTWLTFANVDPSERNVHMLEFHGGWRWNQRHAFGLKAARWSLFEPMGIQFWDSRLMEPESYYPGRLEEQGLGFTYQYFFTRGFFGQIEVLPLWKTYLDPEGRKVGDGFKLYTTYHIGYSFRFWDDRLFLEPQIHCNAWPIDTKAPPEFQAQEDRFDKFFLLEPNIFLGVNF